MKNAILKELKQLNQDYTDGFVTGCELEGWTNDLLDKLTIINYIESFKSVEDLIKHLN